jgi:undecaprenyl-diphosphatase
LTVAAARVAGTAAKILVMSPRPHLIAPPPPLDAFSGFAFPSGHALMSAVAWGAVALFAIRHARTGSARHLTVVLYTALILSIGFSRIYLGAHWPNDVLGGYLYAGCILIAARMLQKKYADRTIAKG